ncbi:SgcJ/EcaC family oxidoreductase [Undibacterium sp. TS12]|uniref:YybH family protein n=1 Tax=Undibacterium sp. TS12 TaxID=2908202 RepID=UPI001F4D149B|nr:SgcJ/EcaC family oxidoreductase [Undibacterium sp. TS12]MCH8621494.1 SgcJ/EcaC family oxidoreductase [Undibacterium sp. TS12]
MQTDKAAVENEISQLIHQWQDATAVGDVDNLLDLMEEDVVFLVAGLAPMRGRQQFADNLRAVLQSHAINSRSEIHDIYTSGDLAYSWSYLKVTISPRQGGQDMVRQGHVLTVWRKHADGKWRISRDANMLSLAQGNPA